MASEHVEEGDQKLIESVMEEFRKMRVCTSKIDEQTAEMENLMKDKHAVISTNNKIVSVNNLDMLNATFSKHISDSAKYLEIHKLGANQRIEMKRRQEDVKGKLEGFFNDVNESIIREIDSNLDDMIEENKRLFDGALEYHAGQTKRHIQWVADSFAKKLVTNRAAHHAEIKDTIALDKALMKEQVREIHRKHAIAIDAVEDQFKDSMKKMRNEKTSAMAMQMQLEAREANFLKMIQEKGEQNRKLKIQMEAMRAEERRALAEREEIERLRVESEERNRRLEEEINKLKDTIKQKNLDIKRLEMFVGGSSNQIEEASIGSGNSKKSKKSKKAAKSPRNKKAPAPLEPIEATNFSFSPSGPASNNEPVGEQTPFEHSAPAPAPAPSDQSHHPSPATPVPAPTSPLAQSVNVARKSIREAEQEEKKLEEKEEEAIHGLEDEIEKIEARVRRDSNAAASAADAESKKHAAQLEIQAREMLEQKKLMLRQKTQLLEQQHNMFYMQQKQKQQELEMLQLQQQQEENTRLQEAQLSRQRDIVSTSVQTSPAHKQQQQQGKESSNSPASPESGGFSVSSSSLDMDHMEDDYSESTWNDIPIQSHDPNLENVYVPPQVTQSAPPTVVSTPVHANLSDGGHFGQPELDLDGLAGHEGLVQSPSGSPDLPPGIISQRIRTASGNDLLKDLRVTETQEVVRIKPSDQPNGGEGMGGAEVISGAQTEARGIVLSGADSPPRASSPAPVEKVEVTKTPLRGNIRPKDKGHLNAGGEEGANSNSPTSFVPSTPDLGYGPNPGQGTPPNPGQTDGPLVAPQAPGLVLPNTPLRNHLVNLEEQIRYLQQSASQAADSHKAQLSQLALQLKERDLLLTEIVLRLKKSNSERATLREKLEKMEFIYDSNVKLKGLNVEGFNFPNSSDRPMTSHLFNIDFANKTLIEGGGAIRPNTAGQYFSSSPASAIGTNKTISLKKQMKKSKKAVSIRNTLKRELLQSR
ncbi:hypothetical protein TrVE_jg8774 [Triparma verrucosa]|uniref:Uncharacterized protein n=1 Tax=Triparma verrucosa TaxID=1606542 RepID=A0A9W6ZCW0_9STRA|nr:hypothetical protein TrVE_jg8774 [Triparma verrucosa]